jgi:hypothetical protein
MSAKITAGIGGHIAGFNKSSEPASQQEFKSLGPGENPGFISQVVNRRSNLALTHF